MSPKHNIMSSTSLITLLFFCFFTLIEPISNVSSVFEYDCPFYEVMGDHKAENGIAVKCRIWLCPGQTVEANMCGYSNFGDNFIRLYNGDTEQTSNDDYW